MTVWGAGRARDEFGVSRKCLIYIIILNVRQTMNGDYDVSDPRYGIREYYIYYYFKSCEWTQAMF